jgi:hypothetical protein
MLSYLRSFAPWLVFAAASALDWRFAALAGLVTAVATTLYARRRQPLDALLLDLGAAVFFAVLAVVGFADAHSPVAGWADTLSLAWLAVIAWASLAVRRPFTLGIARQSAPREMWNSPVFYRVNVAITAVWAATFTAIAVATAVVRLTDAGTIVAVAVYAGYLVPIVFTRRYPALVRARYANQQTLTKDSR